MHDSVVLWDIDGTLISGSLERRLIRYLRRQGRIEYFRLVTDALSTWLRRPLQGWHEFKLLYLRGENVESVDSLVQECWTESILPDLSPGAVEAVRHLNSMGVAQLLISGTPRFLAEPLLRHLEFDNAIAAEPEICDGTYTGRLMAPHPRGRRKVSLADAWLRAHGIGWEQAVVVADHWDDRFLLRKAGVPVAVRGSSRLRRHALRHGWAVVDSPEQSRSSERLVRAILRQSLS